ncbi:MAG: outer membrane beta-barrel protein, partial [Thermoguttaceae bacterium]
MKSTHLVMIYTGLIVCAISTASFAEEQTPELNQPLSVQNAAFARDTYLYFAPNNDSNTAAKSEAAGQTMAKDANDCGQCQSCCSDCESPCCCGLLGGLGHGCNLGDPWTLPQLRVLANRDITISGWLEGGIYTNQYNGSINNGPLGLRDQTDFNADQLWVYAERATNTDVHDLDIGGRVDYVFGVDGPDTQCFGDHSFDWNWTSSYAPDGSALYGSAMPQLYAEIAYKKLKIKAGHFYTSIGYEVVPATGNFFYSHAYMFYYAEPFTHTGALATYTFSDKLSGSAGWTNGWDSGFDDNNRSSTFLGGLTYNMSEKASLACCVGTSARSRVV